MTRERNEANAIIRQLTDIDPESLNRKEALGAELNFIEAIPDAKRVVELFGRFVGRSLDALPDGAIREIRDVGHEVLLVFNEIMDFRPSKAADGNAIAERKRLILKLRDKSQTAFKQLLEFASYISSEQRSSDVLDEYRSAFAQLRGRLTAEVGAAAAERQQVTEILSAAQEASGELAVTGQAAFFKEEACRHEKLAGKWAGWVVATIALVVITAIAGLMAPTWLGWKASSVPEAIQLGIAKALIFAVLTYAVVLSARNFLSHKHNAVLNRHRSNALQTYRALVEAANDEKSREIILSHAALCMFSPQDTGYTKHGSGSSLTAAGLEPLLRIVTRGSS